MNIVDLVYSEDLVFADFEQVFEQYPVSEITKLLGNKLQEATLYLSVEETVKMSEIFRNLSESDKRHIFPYFIPKQSPKSLHLYSDFVRLDMEEYLYIVDTNYDNHWRFTEFFRLALYIKDVEENVRDCVDYLFEKYKDELEDKQSKHYISFMFSEFLYNTYSIRNFQILYDRLNKHLNNNKEMFEFYIQTDSSEKEEIFSIFTDSDYSELTIRPVRIPNITSLELEKITDDLFNNYLQNNQNITMVFTKKVFRENQNTENLIKQLDLLKRVWEIVIAKTGLYYQNPTQMFEIDTAVKGYDSKEILDGMSEWFEKAFSPNIEDLDYYLTLFTEDYHIELFKYYFNVIFNRKDELYD